MAQHRALGIMRDYSDISDSQVLFALQVLEEHGLILDEHATFIGSVDIERNTEALDAFIRHHGYKGGHLQSAGKYFDDHGAVYAIYNSERHSRDSALEFIHKHVDKIHNPKQQPNPTH